MNSAPCYTTGLLQPAFEPPEYTALGYTRVFFVRFKKSINEKRTDDLFTKLKTYRKIKNYAKRGESSAKLDVSQVGVFLLI